MLYAAVAFVSVGIGIILSFILWPRKAADPPAAEDPAVG